MAVPRFVLLTLNPIWAAKGNPSGGSAPWPAAFAPHVSDDGTDGSGASTALVIGDDKSFEAAAHSFSAARRNFWDEFSAIW